MTGSNVLIKKSVTSISEMIQALQQISDMSGDGTIQPENGRGIAFSEVSLLSEDGHLIVQIN